MGSAEQPMVFRVAVQELPKVPSYPWALGAGALSDKQNLILHKCLVRKPGDTASGQLALLPTNAIFLAELRSGASCFAMGQAGSQEPGKLLPHSAVPPPTLETLHCKWAKFVFRELLKLTLLTYCLSCYRADLSHRNQEMLWKAHAGCSWSRNFCKSTVCPNVTPFLPCVLFGVLYTKKN